MSDQQILSLSEQREQIQAYLKAAGISRMFLICGLSVSRLRIYDLVCGLLEELSIEIVHFTDFCPNPQYFSVVEGVRAFRENDCDGILAIGGGSAIDVAKCTKLYAHLDTQTDFLQQKHLPNHIPLIVVPTTAGSGSEATRFAVIYREGSKLSISHADLIPSLVIQYSAVLNELPVYQKKATVLDALCHCMESIWSVNATRESKQYAADGLTCILENIDAYISGDADTNQLMMKAAWAAGKAINLSQTTAGHAMSYKLTDMFGLAHGHAVALCVDKILPFMLLHIEDSEMCLDCRGCEYLKTTLQWLSRVMGGKGMEDAALIFHQLLVRLDMDSTLRCSEEELEVLADSVNMERLKNHPMKLDDKTIRYLYREMMQGKP